MPLWTAVKSRFWLVVLQAVIGAGAAGLVAARELVNEGHKVTVFEKGSCTGGVWVYTDEVENPDLLGRSNCSSPQNVS